MLCTFPGRGVSEWRNGAFRKVSLEANDGSVSVEEEDSGVCGFVPMAVDAAAASESSCSVFHEVREPELNEYDEAAEPLGLGICF